MKLSILLLTGTLLFSTAILVDAQSPRNKNKAKQKNIVLNDPLNGKSTGEVLGGEFLPNGGWKPVKANDRIVWNLTNVPIAGKVEFDVKGLDPSKTTASKNIFFGLWGQLFANKEGLVLPDTDGIEIRVDKDSGYKYKIEYHSQGHGKVRQFEPYTTPYDPSATYHFEFEWHDSTVVTRLNDKELVFQAFSEDPINHFNFMHIGTAPIFGGNFTEGLVFSNIKMSALKNKKKK